MLAVRHRSSTHVRVKHQIKQRDLQQASGFCSRCSRGGRCPRSNLDAHASACPGDGAADVLQGDVWGVGLLDLGNLKDGLGRDLAGACMTRSLAPLLKPCRLLYEVCDRRRLGGLQRQQQGSRQELVAAAPCSVTLMLAGRVQQQSGQEAEGCCTWQSRWQACFPLSRHVATQQQQQMQGECRVQTGWKLISRGGGSRLKGSGLLLATGSEQHRSEAHPDGEAAFGPGSHPSANRCGRDVHRLPGSSCGRQGLGALPDADMNAPTPGQQQAWHSQM